MTDSHTKTAKNAGSYHHGDLKSSLIQAALDILDRDGAEALSLRAIAQEVGVSHTAPYSHFKNKRQLISAIKNRGFELLADGLLENVDAKDDGDQVVLAYGAAYLQFAIDHPELYRLMLGQVEARGLKGDYKPVPINVEQEHIVSSRPFVLLTRAFGDLFESEGLARSQALGAWALVHGLAALLIEGYLVVPASTDLREFLASVTPNMTS